MIHRGAGLLGACVILQACAQASREIEIGGCRQPQHGAFAKTVRPALTVDPALASSPGYGQLVVRLFKSDSTQAPLADAIVRASSLNHEPADTTRLRGDRGVYAAILPIGNYDISPRRVGVANHRDTMAVRAQYTDTLDLSLVPVTMCIEGATSSSAHL